MTTVSARDGVIASDTMMSAYNIRHTMPGLKLFIAGQYAVAVAGDCRYIPLLKRWFSKDCPPGEEGFSRMWEDEWDALAMDVHGNLFVLLADTLQPVGEPFYSIGSGRDLALGAMAMGASAREATAIAGRFDRATNTDVEAISTEDLRKHLKK